MKTLNSFRTIISNQSLKRKWAFTSAVVIFISFAVICSILYLSIYSWLMKEEEQSVKRTMDDLIVFFESQGNQLTISDIQSNKGLMNSIVDKNQTVRILNKDGIEVLRINDLSLVPPPIPKDIPKVSYLIEEVKVDQTTAFSAFSPIRIGSFTGYLQLTHPLNSFQSLMNYILITMIIFGVGALFLSSAIGYVLAGALLKPLRDLRLEMTKVAQVGFDAPVTFSYKAEDELGDLIKVYRSMMDELQKSFTQQQQFISDASHELRTPIQVVEGHLSLLKRWGKENPEVLEESLDTSLVEIARMRKMIEEMLELARRQERNENAEVHVLSTLQQLQQEIELLYPKTSISIQMDALEVQDMYAAMTQNALEQIIRNLVLNAIRYCEKQPSIQIQVSIHQHMLQIIVQDNGIGIHEKDLPYIFDRFYRIDSSRSRDGGGTGLGLSIVKMLIERYEGEVTVESEVEKGTRFTILLPVRL